MLTLVKLNEVGWKEENTRSRATELSLEKNYDSDAAASALLDDFYGEHSQLFQRTTTRTSPPISLSGLRVSEGNQINGIYLQADVFLPVGTSIKYAIHISTSETFDEANWREVKLNEMIPLFLEVVELKKIIVKIRQTLTSIDEMITPMLKNMSIGVQTRQADLNAREEWQTDTRLLAKFLGDLEAGNINNSGVRIEKFAIKRRKVDELEGLTIGYEKFVNNAKVEYLDLTQSNDAHIYSVVPIGENNLEGKPNEVTIESDFVGWWIVDKDSSEVLGFDKSIGDVGKVDVQLNQDRVEIKTFSRYPNIWYSPTDYSTFTLSTVLIPNDLERSGKNFERVVRKFVTKHIPMIVKDDTGRIFVCDISNPRFSTPMNTWKGNDYIELALDFTEIEDYRTFMKSN